jgi:hypothetical protein
MQLTGQPRLKFLTLKDLHKLPQLQKLSDADRAAMEVVAHVLPFRTNNYVVDELIDWDRIPDDPIFQLTFPQAGMLSGEHLARMWASLAGGQSAKEVRAVADQIRRELNPHPEGQLQHNVPRLDDRPVLGVQHKYRETCRSRPAQSEGNPPGPRAKGRRRIRTPAEDRPGVRRTQERRRQMSRPDHEPKSKIAFVRTGESFRNPGQDELDSGAVVDVERLLKNPV